MPDINLLPDMFHVTSAQGFVVELINAIKTRQVQMGTDVATGSKFIEKKLQHIGAGGGAVPAASYLNLTFNDKGYIEGDGLRSSRVNSKHALEQSGGIFIDGFIEYYNKTNYKISFNKSYVSIQSF